MVGRVTARGSISRCVAAAWRGRTRWDSAVVQPGSAGVGWKKELTSGDHASAREREKAPRTEGMNQRRKRLLQNTPKARAGRAAERPSGLGGLSRPAGQGRRSGRAGWAGKEKKKEIH
jgi:hypothetical protein